MRKVVLLALMALVLVLGVTPLVKADNVSAPTDFTLAKSNTVTNIAEVSLKMVADRDRTGRVIGGACLVAGGGLIAVSGIAAGNEVTGPLLIVGGIIAGSGGLILLIPTQSEKEYRKVMKVADPGEREYAAEVSLEYLADKAKRNRIISGISSAASGVLNLYVYKSNVDSGNSELASTNLYSAIISFGTAAYQFLVPSYVERINDKVKQQKATNVGWGTDDGQIPVLVYNF